MAEKARITQEEAGRIQEVAQQNERDGFQLGADKARELLSQVEIVDE